MDADEGDEKLEGQAPDGEGREREAEAQEPRPEGEEAEEGAGADGPEGFRALIDARDRRIAELEAEVAGAAESKARADELGRRIEELKAESAEERVGYELRLAGARSVKAARAVLADYDGDIGALRAAEPWMFRQAPAASGASGLEPAGAAGGSDGRALRRWERIAGVADEEE